MPAIRNIGGAVTRLVRIYTEHQSGLHPRCGRYAEERGEGVRRESEYECERVALEFARSLLRSSSRGPEMRRAQSEYPSLRSNFLREISFRSVLLTAALASSI